MVRELQRRRRPPKCHAEHSPRKKSGFRSWLWKHAPDAVAALVRLVVGHRIGYGRKQETFLLVTSFRLAHETAVDTVAAYFRDRAQSCVCRAEEAQEVSRMLERECKAELHRANEVRCAIDPAVRKKMRTLYVAQTILSIQRDAVCSLARRGLVSTKEMEVLLEEVLEDLEEVFKLEEGRSHEQGAHGGEHGGVEHWVDGDHTLPSHAVHKSNCRGASPLLNHGLHATHRSQDVEAHFSARPADASRLANSRMFGTNGAYASVRARIGDTRRILDLRTSGEAAEWCGAHIASTRRRMDRASTVAPSSRASTVETIETQDSTTEAH